MIFPPFRAYLWYSTLTFAVLSQTAGVVTSW